MDQKPGESNEMSSGIASHSKSRSGCITCKTRRVKCDEGKPHCLRCSAAGYNCAGYSDSNECTDIRILKKSKQFHAKSRFGCTTCKKRRVKCDEGKPACLRCTNGGHECGGYDDLQEQKRKSMAKCGSVVLLPQFEDKHQILPVVTLSGPLSVTGSSEDQRSFDFFRSKTVHVLTGYFDNDFWKKLLLQISTSEPTVRHAILAVGALHEHYGIEHLESSHKNRQLALNHYIRAVKLLTGQDKHKKQSIEIIAVTCLLFACLELLLNDISGAIAHIRSGVLIIRSWKAKNNRLRRRLTGSDDIIQNYLAPAFDHMNLNSFVYSKTIALEHEYDNTEEFKHFETLFDARSALYNVRNSIVFFRPSFGISKTELSPALQREQFLDIICEKWTTTFNSLLARSIHTKSSSFVRGARLLKLQYGIVDLFSRHILFVSDMELDNLTGIFSELLDYCELVLEIEAGNLSAEFNGTFSLQLRSVWPVYKVALDCRNPTIRRRAVSLLKQQPKRKGFWNSDLIINILESAIEIEERGLEDLTDFTGAVVPSAWARLKNLVIDVDSMQESRTVLVSFFHKANGIDAAQVERREFAL